MAKAKTTSKQTDTGKHKCQMCGKVFQMPAHLRRHMAVAHPFDDDIEPHPDRTERPRMPDDTDLAQVPMSDLLELQLSITNELKERLSGVW